jgi:hypothetical protein
MHQSGMPGARPVAPDGPGSFGALHQLRLAASSRATAAGTANAYASADARVVQAVRPPAVAGGAGNALRGAKLGESSM